MPFRKGKADEESNAFLPSSEESTGSTCDSDEDEEPHQCHNCGALVDADAAFCPKCGAKQVRESKCGKCGWRCCCCCCCCFLCLNALLLGAVVLALLTMNTWAKVALEETGRALFGTEVSIGAMDLGLLSTGRTSITNMTVASPPGYEDSFFKLGQFVFDLSLQSVLAAYFTTWIAPIDLREITIRDVTVFVDMNWTTTKEDGSGTECNAKTIVDNMNEATKPLPTVSPAEGLDIGLHAMSAKLKVGKVELSNISANVLIRPFLSEPVSYELDEVLVKGVGQNGGVYVWEFAEILSRAILMSIIRGAPGNIRANLAKVFGPDLWKNLDYEELAYDAGKGLEKVSEFSGWATAEATLLPLKFAALNAKITGKAIATGAKMNLEATKMNTKMIGMGIKANMAATNAAMKASWKATQAGMKLRNAFTMGWLHALR